VKPRETSQRTAAGCFPPAVSKPEGGIRGKKGLCLDTALPFVIGDISSQRLDEGMTQ
jgi:hypothetical protein